MSYLCSVFGDVGAYAVAYKRMLYVFPFNILMVYVLTLKVFMLFTTLMQRCTFRFPDDVTLPVSLDGDLGNSWRAKPYNIIAQARNEF